MIRRPPRSTRKESSAASDVYKRQIQDCVLPTRSKTAALNDLEKLHKELDLRVLRESDVLRHAQQQYADEMARRSSTKAKDTPTFQDQDAVAIKDEPIASAKLQRTSSIHGREKKNTSTPTSELMEQGDTHAMKRSHLQSYFCLLYTSPSPRDGLLSRMPSSA